MQRRPSAGGIVSEVESDSGMSSCPGQFERCLFAGDQLEGEINQLPVTEGLLQKGGYCRQSVFGIRGIEIETTAQNDGKIRMKLPNAFGEFIAADLWHGHVGDDAVEGQRAVRDDLQCFSGVTYSLGDESCEFQSSAHKIQNRQLIINNQYPSLPAFHELRSIVVRFGGFGL